MRINTSGIRAEDLSEASQTRTLYIYASPSFRIMPSTSLCIPIVTGTLEDHTRVRTEEGERPVLSCRQYRVSKATYRRFRSSSRYLTVQSINPSIGQITI